jgi:hypothetical protein
MMRLKRRFLLDLSPNLSPARREALNFSPFPDRKGSWGVRSSEYGSFN